MAYTAGKSKHKDTWEYWDLWNRKNKRVEAYFLEKWQSQFEEIRKVCKGIEKPENLIDADLFDHDAYYSEYLGSVFAIKPSGKYYMPFASSNVSMKEAAIDEFWQEEFEKILSEENCWDQCGEGDPCDIFICKSYGDPPTIRNADHEKILLEKIMPGLTPADYLEIDGIYEILVEYYENDILAEVKKEGK